MPTGPSNLEGLPEPANLQAQLSLRRALDWGEPVPTKKEIAAEFGEDATARSLSMLTRAAAVEDHLTADLLASVRPGTVAFHLQSRLKSPQSLARKLRKIEGSQYAAQPLEDILRYTVVTPEPDDLISTAVGTVEQLRTRGWAMESVHHSYAEGSRYKGLHAFLRSRGELIELQIHSQESIDVKSLTTPLYEVERDPRQNSGIRDAARKASVAMSDQMSQPTGISELTELGGVAVTVRSYGRRRRPLAVRPPAGETAAGKAAAPRHRPETSNQHDGISR